MIRAAAIVSFCILLNSPSAQGQIDAKELALKAKVKHGAIGERAVDWLVASMPAEDRAKLTNDFLMAEVDLALAARKEFPWASAVPEEVYFNNVLPYAVFDESRDPWRAEFLARCRPLVAGCRTATEAAQALNREIFKLVKVHYNTGRKRPNQSAKESMASGRATCTGLAIILVDACRSVGVPARAAGTALWTNLRGNHTWVEVWDGGWHFTGADEYDANGLDRGWFVGDASQAKADVPKHAIFATSWKRGPDHFPMVWSPGSKEVAAVNVTSRYAKPASEKASIAKVGVRVVEKGADGKPVRIVAKLDLFDEMGGVVASSESKSGTSDWNDLGVLAAPAPGKYLLRVTRDAQVREQEVAVEKAGDTTIQLTWTELPFVSFALLEAEKSCCRPPKERGVAPTSALSKAEAARVLQTAWNAELKRLKAERADEMEKKAIVVDGKEMKFLEKTFGDAPADGRSLWISMHGGGGAPAKVNDGQWQNQIRLYTPKEGLYIAPRAPTNTWNLWHEAHIDGLFDRLIADCVALRNVNPDKVYLMGYSAGGDGVWQLAPRMADRWAAASMMAGHPNNASLAPLRNLPFAIFMGGDDKAYDRNKVAAEKAALLDRLQKADPGGYEHFVRIYPGLGHWMQRKDAEALPWMEKHSRIVWPKKVVWEQVNVPSDRFYWLAMPKGDAKVGQKATAEVAGQTIRINVDGARSISLRLSDHLLDLDKPVVVEVNGKKLHESVVPRTAAAIQNSLASRFDRSGIATAELTLKW